MTLGPSGVAWPVASQFTLPNQFSLNGDLCQIEHGQAVIDKRKAAILCWPDRGRRRKIYSGGEGSKKTFGSTNRRWYRFYQYSQVAKHRCKTAFPLSEEGYDNEPLNVERIFPTRGTGR